VPKQQLVRSQQSNEKGGWIMMQRRKRGWRFLGVGIAAILALSAFGCASVLSNQGGSEAKKDVPMYMDFGDVMVPRELKIVKDQTFIYRTAGHTSGVLTFKGDVEMNSLIAFFENNMTKDNWKKIGEFKSPRTVLLFQKENRHCVINMLEGQYECRVEIWVMPTMQVEAGLLK